MPIPCTVHLVAPCSGSFCIYPLLAFFPRIHHHHHHEIRSSRFSFFQSTARTCNTRSWTLAGEQTGREHCVSVDFDNLLISASCSTLSDRAERFRYRSQCRRWKDEKFVVSWKIVLCLNLLRWNDLPRTSRIRFSQIATFPQFSSIFDILR